MFCIGKMCQERGANDIPSVEVARLQACKRCHKGILHHIVVAETPRTGLLTSIASWFTFYYQAIQLFQGVYHGQV